MKPERSPTPFRPSLLDRLLGLPGVARRYQTLEEFGDSLRRDLEDLLNARSSAGDVPAWAGHCAASILHYGLPDRAFDADPAGAAAMVRDAIAAFEPRLCEVRVEPLTPDVARPDRAALEIRARLVADRSTTLRLWARFHSVGVGRITLTRPD